MEKVELPIKKRYAAIQSQLIERHAYTNPMAIPRLQKIVVNMGLGEAREDSKVLEKASKELAQITLQRPAVTRAKKSVSNFKIRAGMPVGLRVTLRGVRMWAFLDRLVNVALPRVRDFRGLNPNSFDGRGNYAMGIKEHIIFPEIDYDPIDQVWGMDIVITTTAKSDDEARALLKAFNFPFRT